MLLSVDPGYFGTSKSYLNSAKRILQKQKADWPCVFLPGGWSEVSRIFHLSGYALLLVDAQGIVRGVDLRGDELDQAVGQTIAAASKHPEVQPGSQPATSEETIFLGTVTKIDIGNTRHPVLRWVVTLRIDKVITGELPGETFRLAIHSPSQEGVEPGHQYRMLVRKRGDGYDYCGPHPWLDVVHDRPGPK